tara:strand:+ start:1147 stop:1368 length:222 start_codon:yes stop_codon:yes gene_type:complete
MSFESEYNAKIEALKKKFIASVPKDRYSEIDSEEKKALVRYIEKIYHQEISEADYVAEKRETVQELRQKYSSY